MFITPPFSLYSKLSTIQVRLPFVLLDRVEVRDDRDPEIRDDIADDGVFVSSGSGVMWLIGPRLATNLGHLTHAETPALLNGALSFPPLTFLHNYDQSNAIN